jgi:hypothetical protein
VGDLSRDMCNLLSKRKEHLTNIERLHARTRQNELTYADMERKKNKLEEGLRKVRKQLEADERQLKREKESIEDILGQTEQLALELKDLCLES